jgi:hypothetical protein
MRRGFEMEAETAMNTAKWASIMNHVKNNRIEYLLMVGILHLVGATNKAYAQVQGVCL